MVIAALCALNLALLTTIYCMSTRATKAARHIKVIADTDSEAEDEQLVQ